MSEMKIVMGDFNAKTGEGRQNQTVGPHGLGTRNECGDALVEWCEEKELIVTNTWFKQHKHRLFTWKSPDEQINQKPDRLHSCQPTIQKCSKILQDISRCRF